jgi:hypothetical protein
MRGVTGKNKYVRTRENIHRVQGALTQSPKESVKHPSQQLDLRALSTCRIIREDVELSPKMEFLIAVDNNHCLYATAKFMITVLKCDLT